MDMMAQRDIDISSNLLVDDSKPKMEYFEELYKNTSSFVYNVAYRITGNSYNAEEVAQEVFIKVFKNLNKFEFRSNFKTWIYRITINTAINYQKKLSREKKHLADFDEHIKYTDKNEVHELENKDSGNKKEKLIKQLLNNLKPKYRACIILREIEGLSYKDIAYTLKTNINTVRTILKRSRQRLIELVRENKEDYYEM